MIVSGGDGCEQFSPGTTGNLTGPSDLSHFMSYCSNLAVSFTKGYSQKKEHSCL